MEWKEVTRGLRFPEGPVAMPDGSVIVVELARSTITRVSANGEQTLIAKVPGTPNGAALGPDGALYIANNGGMSFVEKDGVIDPSLQAADYIGGRIQRVTLDGEVSDLYTEAAGEPFLGPNDLIFDETGGFYFTDHGHRRERDIDRSAIYYATPDGSHIHRVISNLFTANGVALSPDGKRLYASETIMGRVWFWEVEGPGRVKSGPGWADGATLLAAPEGFHMFDSMAVDAEGNVAVATLSAGGITVIAPDGSVKFVTILPDADPSVTNIAFGGPGLRTAYVTAGGRGRLYAAEWPYPGLPLHFADATPTPAHPTGPHR